MMIRKPLEAGFNARHNSSESNLSAFDGTTDLTNENGTILIPIPTPDPRDPLNIPTAKKYFILVTLIIYAVSGLALVTSLGALLVYFLDDYQTQGITQQQISGLLTWPGLFLGVGNIVSIPLSIAVGRRPILLLSLLLLLLASILCATNRNFTWHLAARSLAAFAAAQCQALVFLIIQDVFFLHQRGRTIQLFSSFEVLLNSTLTIASSYMAAATGWRSWYWLFVALSCASTILAVFFVPETAYARPISAYRGKEALEYMLVDGTVSSSHQENTSSPAQPLTTNSRRKLDTTLYEPRTLRSDLRVFVLEPDPRRALTTWKQICSIWFFPHVLWVTLMNGFFQGTDICIQITYGRTLVSPPYSWSNTSVSLIQIGQIIVALLSIPFIGWYSDSNVQMKARRNKGVHEPEHRLPPLVAPLLICIGMTILYGFAVQYPGRFHWFVIPFTVNIWLFLLLGASTVGTTYLLDAHPSRAAAIMTVIPVTRGLVGFGLSYHTVDYIAAIGAARLFGILPGIMGIFGVLGVLLFWKGKVLRSYVAKWTV